MTQLHFSVLDLISRDFWPLARNLQIGDTVRITPAAGDNSSLQDITKFQLFTVAGTASFDTAGDLAGVGTVNLPVTFVGASGTNADNNILAVIFGRNGSFGPTGATGATGPTGA